jgi:hypothetical protein
MPGSFLPYPLPPTGYAASSLVVRYHRGQSGSARFEVLPNVRCEGVRYQQGLTLPSAQFSYVLDDTVAYDWPARLESLWPMGLAASPYVVQDNDELLVYLFTDTGDRFLLFDGFAQVPQADQSGGIVLSFVAVNVAVRLWDDPVGGADYRDSDAPESGDLVPTSLPTWFNPNGRPNKTPAGHDYHDGLDDQRGLFLDVETKSTTAGIPAYWNLADFCHYLAWTYNPTQTYVYNFQPPTADTLDEYLVSVTPVDGHFMDLTDPTTYTTSPITIRSFDATGKPWPEAAAEQLGYYGFQVFINTYEDPEDPGAPVNDLVVYRTDGRDGNAPKAIYYPLHGTSIETGVPGFDGLAIARDHFEPYNAVDVEIAPKEYEVSLILAPGFEIAAGDSSNIALYDSSKMANASAETRRKYRYFTFDEAGTGHWNYGGNAWATGTATSLDAVLGAPDADGLRQYVHRPRKGSHTVFAVDALGKPRKAELAISRDYAGPCPGVWDRSGTWRSLGDASWKLDETGLAVWITADNPESWKLPKSADSLAPGDVVRTISDLASLAASRRLYLRLTTVIQGDVGLVTADRRDATPTPFAIYRRIDSRDHWRRQVAHVSSAFNSTGAEVVIRDDEAKAQAHAESLRLANEFPSVVGSIRVPWISLGIGVGDAVGAINGRDISLATNAGTAAGEGPRLPYVIGIAFNLQNPQTTTIKLTDRRTEPEAATHGFGRST